MKSEKKEPKPKYNKQEKEPASEEITEVAPNVLRSQLPVEIPGIGHVNCYFLEDSKGLAIVDPGLPGPKSHKALLKRLNMAGYKIKNVHTVIVTHSHFDHFGGAERVRSESGAHIMAHKDFRVMWSAREVDENIESTAGKGYEDEDDDVPFLPKSGVTPWGTEREKVLDAEIEKWKKLSEKDKTWFKTPEPSWKVSDSEFMNLAGREWRALHTPGHTADHLCLYDPEFGVLLAGDHILPTITPHIGGVDGFEDPLTNFFTSLKRVSAMEDIKIALPAHGHPFENIPKRVDEIMEHHRENLDVIRETANELSKGTVNDYMKRLFKERVWGTMAESETFSHLLYLEIAGEVSRNIADDGVISFRKTERLKAIT